MLKFPNTSQRIAIMGRTGSGKTYAGAYHLARQSIDMMPWVIIDYKTDELINSIERGTDIDYGDAPKKPGIYRLHPLPGEDEKITDFLWKIWGREKTGLFIDEGYMVGSNPAFEACLTQGRSKKIPIIVNTQRPAWLSRFVFSEADFFQVFHLNDKRDHKTVQSFVPIRIDERLPEYHSYYYDVNEDKVSKLLPVPDRAGILSLIDAKLGKVRRTL